MQRKIEIKYKSKAYIVKVDDEMRYIDVLKILNINPQGNYQLLLTTKKRYVQPFNKLKDLNVVNNDIINILLENDEKAI